jgi:oligopeptide/dipeptide ABC transporter ATP-binding protein
MTVTPQSSGDVGLAGSAPDDRGRPPGSALLAVSDLEVRFGQRNRLVHAVNGVTFSLAARQTLAVIGESGAGKSVMVRAAMGLLPPTATVRGSVLLDGAELIGAPEKQLRAVRGSKIAMVFQDPTRSLNPRMRVGTQIAEALRTHLPLSRPQAKERAVELLSLVRMPTPRTRYNEYPHQLSGGMRQRVMIAIALACRPELLIADEATTALDVTTQAQIMELMLDLQVEMGMALVLISHDMGLAASYTDDILVMYAGRIVEQAPTARLFGNVRMPYTKALLDAIPRVDQPAHTRFAAVQGRPPDLRMLEESCAFHPRCPQAQDRCRAELPTLVGDEPGHRYACFFPYDSNRGM